MLTPQSRVHPEPQRTDNMDRAECKFDLVRHLTNPLSEDRVFGTREGSDRWALTAESFVT